LTPIKHARCDPVQSKRKGAFALSNPMRHLYAHHRTWRNALVLLLAVLMLLFLIRSAAF